MGKYWGDRGRGKKGKLMVCPKCGYKWKVKNPKKPYICCSNCKKYFNPNKEGRSKRR